MKLRIRGFRAIPLQHETPQEDCLAWLAAAHARSSEEPIDPARFEKLLGRFGCSPKQISRRGHECADFTHQNWQEMELFSESYPKAGAPMEKRMEVYQRGALRAFRSWFPQKADLTFRNLIHVSCTGYISPSAAQMHVCDLGLEKDCQITHAYHMGCYAAIPALRIAAGFLGKENSEEVAVAHTEFCSLHLNPTLSEPEQLVVQSLFADGLIHYVVTRKSCPGLIVHSIREEQVPNTQDQMEWVPQSWGMGMTLAREVPDSIRKSLQGYLERLFKDAGMSYAEEKSNLQFAIHPGGPKILDGIRDELSLRREQLAISGRVLFEHGNMSSATLPYIWEQYMQEKEIPSGTKIVSLAFGPGLTIAGAILEKDVIDG